MKEARYFLAEALENGLVISFEETDNGLSVWADDPEYIAAAMFEYMESVNDYEFIEGLGEARVYTEHGQITIVD